MTKLKEINKQPLFDMMIVTAERISFTPSGILITDNMEGKRQISSTQTVLSTGWNTPEQLKRGTRIELNLETFPRKAHDPKHGVGGETFTVEPPLYADTEGYEFMIVSPRNLLYIIEDEVE